MVTTVGPQDVLDAVRVARGALSSVAEPSGVRGSREEWAAVAGELQHLVNEATAVQDAAVVRLAAVEPQWCEDGTVVEVHKPLGHAALDAPSILSGVLNLTAVAAERRVRHALRTAADGPDGTESCTGLGGLHAAMAAGRLDAYRAQVVAAELEECPAEVAATVVASLDGWFDVEDGARLRRRARRMLARVAPDLLRQRAARARSESSLRRWVDQPGVDTWLGTFPSEEACRAWAAIDALAQRYVADGTCERVDRARAKALTDLVTGHATVDVQVVLTTAGSGRAERRARRGLRPRHHRPGVGRPWLARAGRRRHHRHRPRPGRTSPRRGVRPRHRRPHRPRRRSLATDAYRPGRRLTELVKARDGRCRFPGCHVAARCCDLDHLTPWPAGPTTAGNLACLCRRHHRVKQRPGWTVRIHPDATLTWTDPTGRTRTTHPVDHLHHATLPTTGHDPDPNPPPGIPCLTLPDTPHSTLEHRHEHHLGSPRARPTTRADTHDLTRRHLAVALPRHHARARRGPDPPEGPPF